MFWLMNKYPNWLDRILFERSHTFYRQLKMDYHMSLTLHGSYEGITLVKVKISYCDLGQGNSFCDWLFSNYITHM